MTGQGMTTSARKPRLPVRFRRKVVVYATHRDASGLTRLLVFSKPDRPELGLEVPGGTIEADESAEAAARREFTEETGLAAPSLLTLLGEMTYVFRGDTPDEGAVRFEHRRSYFHVVLEDAPDQPWDFLEQTPDSGGAPIRLRHEMVPMLPVPVLFARLDAFFPALYHHLGISVGERAGERA